MPPYQYIFVKVGEQIIDGDELLIGDPNEYYNDKWVYFVEDSEHKEYVKNERTVRRMV